MSRRAPAWTRRRPATTVCSTPRIAAPAPRDRDPHWRPHERPPSQWRNAIRISVAEATTLQGFRRDYPWHGSRSRCFLQIGNAVCPPLARRVVAAAACQSLAKERSKRR